MLVAPVNKISAQVERTIEFKGLNRKSYVDEGEMSAMKNLTSDNYPTLTPRKARTIQSMPSGVTPLSIMSRYDRLCVIGKKTDNSIAFYFGGGKSREAITEIAAITGLSANTRMVAINTKICFFPEKKCIDVVRSASDVVTFSNYRSIEETKSLTSATVTISTDDTRIDLGSTHNFAYDDGIVVYGTLNYTSGSESKSKTCDISCAIEEVSGNVLVLPRDSFIELIGEDASSVTFTGDIMRTCPGFTVGQDYVCEYNNRLWMAVSGDNTIYACKLGDPTNWTYYQGTNMDSYYAQQGTDGLFTGYAPYSSHLIFFKEDYMTRIYGSVPEEYQITNTRCYGVEQGSNKSVAIINDMVLYKSVIGLMAYEGSSPYEISAKFGDTKFKNAVGGTDGAKYYVSLDAGVSDQHDWHMVTCDIESALWHEEDNTQMVDCCSHNGHMYFINSDGTIYATNRFDLAADADGLYPSATLTPKLTGLMPSGAGEGTIAWMATFGPYTEYVENKKIYSKLSLRMEMPAESTVSIWIAMDEGTWEKIEEYTNTTKVKKGIVVPIIPRRCDRFSIKIEGTGQVSVNALTRRYRAGGYI